MDRRAVATPTDESSGAGLREQVTCAQLATALDGVDVVAKTGASVTIPEGKATV